MKIFKQLFCDHTPEFKEYKPKTELLIQPSYDPIKCSKCGKILTARDLI